MNKSLSLAAIFAASLSSGAISAGAPEIDGAASIDADVVVEACNLLDNPAAALKVSAGRVRVLDSNTALCEAELEAPRVQRVGELEGGVEHCVLLAD